MIKREANFGAQNEGAAGQRVRGEQAVEHPVGVDVACWVSRDEMAGWRTRCGSRRGIPRRW